MASNKGERTVGGVLIINSDLDPSGGIGTVPTGSLVLASDGSGIFYKFGAGATNYSQVPTSPSGGVVGDLLVRTSATAFSNLADIATGNVLLSGGVGVIPSYGKVGLTTHVSGTLGLGNGGTGTATTFTLGSVVIAGASGIYTQDNANFFWDDTNNRLGIGTTTPTAFADLAASVAAGATLRIRSGTAPTAANQNNGDIWNDSTQKVLSINLHGATTIVQNIETCIFTQTANTNVNNTTTETTLLGTGIGTKTLPADFFTAGKTIRLTLRGFFSRTSGNITIRFKLGTTTICATATASSGAGSTDGFQVIVDCTCRTTGAGGTFFGQGWYQNLNNGNVIEMVTSATVAVDTTASQIINTTIQFSTANAGNTFTSTNCTIEVLN